jgi:hypothetical protein
MGLLDRLGRKDVADTRSALDAARSDQPDDSAVSRLINRVVAVGIDGLGPLDPAVHVAEEALAEEGGDREAAVRRVARKHLVGGAVGGAVTSVGGFVTMPVALPANVLEFYVQATRMVAAIAHLRGYDVTDPHIRVAVLLTLVGSDADDVLAKAGMTTGGGRLASLAFQKLPPAAMLVINKAVGFRLLKGVGGRLAERLGRGVPLVGGAVGGGVDAWMMKRIGDHAMQEFPPA